MAFVVFLLLCGMLAAEIALFGFKAAGVVGAVLLACCAAVLATKQPSIGE